MFRPRLRRRSTTQFSLHALGRTVVLGVCITAFTLGLFLSTTPASADPDGSVVSCSRSFPSDPTPYPDSAEEVEEFAHAWFDSLSTHASAAHLAEFVDFHSLVMTFPPPPVQDPPPPPPPEEEEPVERPQTPAPIVVPSAVCDEMSFYKWYSALEARYADTHYDVVSLDTAGNEEQTIVFLTVHWTGNDIPTGTVFEQTSHHRWTLLPGGPHSFVIEAYLVDTEDMTE